MMDCGNHLSSLISYNHPGLKNVKSTMDLKPPNETLRVFQIYFGEKSQKNCYPEWIHYDNSKGLTEYFENSVIVQLISEGAHLGAKYFGVVSHDFYASAKFKEWVTTDKKLSFSPQNLETVITNHYPGIDVFSFQKRRQNPNIVFQAERYHPGFIKAMDYILKETGFIDGIPNKLNHVILFNHFIARSEIYERYVKELLIPAMEVMKGMPELWNDAKYKNVITPEVKDRFMKSFGKPFYPLHPFICERLPSIFMEKYKYSFRHIF